MSCQSLQSHWRPCLCMHIIVIGMSVEKELLGYASPKVLINFEKRLLYEITVYYEPILHVWLKVHLELLKLYIG